MEGGRVSQSYTTPLKEWGPPYSTACWVQFRLGDDYGRRSKWIVEEKFVVSIHFWSPALEGFNPSVVGRPVELSASKAV